MRSLIDSLADVTGLRVREQDREALPRWAAERVRELKLPGLGQYGELLAEEGIAGRRERELLSVRFTTGETYFFRDRGLFELLEATLLPELLEGRAAQRRLRIWSAGSSTGEEAYSLAMLIDERAPRLAGWCVQILATDIDSEALEKARQGVYGDWAFRALDDARKQRYFRRQGRGWQIVPRLRDMVTFRRGDLVRDRFPESEGELSNVDLILCRNVFIYLEASAIAGITAKFAATLCEGGCLITGHGELFGHDTGALRLRMLAQSAVLQKATQPASDSGPSRVLPGLPVPARAAAWTPATRIESQEPRCKPRSSPAQPPTPTAEECDQLMQAAWRHADRGRHGQAEQECRKVIELGAFDPRPYYLLAKIAQECGDTAQAKALLAKVIYLDPLAVAVYIELGALHSQSGESSCAQRMYETARVALRKLPAQSAVAPYGESTAADILAYVERELARVSR